MSEMDAGTLRTAVMRLQGQCPDLAEAVNRVADKMVAVPDRTFVDDRGCRWEWCGGVEGTWAWRMTAV